MSSPEKIYFSYNQIHKTIKSLSEKIKASDFTPDIIVAIGTGGFIPARMLKTFMPLPILTVGLSYYDVNNQPKDSIEKIQWIDEVEQKLEGKKILLVDEVDDSRYTLEYCLRELLAHNPAQMGVAVLHNKLKEKRGIIPDEIEHYFQGQDLEDQWVCYPWDADDIDFHDNQGK